MTKKSTLSQLLSTFVLWLAACASTDDGVRYADSRDQISGELERETGAPVTLEVGETGNLHVLALTPQRPVPGRVADPARVAMDFLVTHHDVFQIDAAEAGQFVVTRVDNDRAGDIRHVTLQRVYNGIPVFQGAITVHMDSTNSVFRVLGDDAYHITAPTNRMVLSPTEAAKAALHALNLKLSVALASSDGQHAVFSAAGALDPIHVDQMIFHAAQDDDRFAYQATISWLDENKQLQYQLALIDATDGSLLANYSLVNTFTGRVFNKGAQPTANLMADTRTVVPFDGDPMASPIGWVDATRKTRGNNAIAVTDLNGDNVIGVNEVQPSANASNSFDFPFSPLQDASNFKEASVTNAFYFVNDWHDRAYLLGFTESAGNFQSSNFGKMGAQNDEVQVDVQDGSGLNNANFATPPDGQKPRMQMYLFTTNGGPKKDGDFDPTVVYHENTHGLSNRLVGNGSTTCLPTNHVQSGGMGEGWSDFMAASFLYNPVIGAYVTGNAATGIRHFSMANSPLTFADIQNGTLQEVHDVGELWAATLWDMRSFLGAAIAEKLVVSAMKLTPCFPTMLQARDAILQADANINAGANRCAIFSAFAGRQMGVGASSPNDNSTSSVVTSSSLPTDCRLAITRIFYPLFICAPPCENILDIFIPDDDPTGVRSVINVPTDRLDIQRVMVDVDITHTFVGDLVIQVIAPNGQTATLSNRAGGSADNFVVTGLDITSSFSRGASASGQWQLFVRDLAAQDVGTINSFVLHITSSH